MNTPTTVTRESMPVLFAYGLMVVVLLAAYLGGAITPLVPEKLADTTETLVFCIIAMCGALALKMGAPSTWTVIIGSLGSFIALTAYQEPLLRYLTLGALLFAIGIYGMVVSRNAVRVLMCIELLLNAVNINLVAFARYVDPGTIKGQVFAIFILTVAAAEAAVGLAIVLTVYRNMETVDMERFNLLKW